MKKQNIIKKITIKKRNINSCKGDNGRVLIIAGSVDYPGAAVLASQAALAMVSGADLVTVAAPEKVAWVINTYSPVIITKKLKGTKLSLLHYKELIPLIKKCDCILIGPGIGGTKSEKELIRKILTINKPKIVDAGAIREVNIRKIKNTIITPHQKEYEDLLKLNKISKNQIQKELGENVILLKGPTDTIITSTRKYHNKTGNAGMTKGGTGDVLAGICAGLVSQKNTLLNSANAAAYITGAAGDILYKKKGYTFTAENLINETSQILKPILK